MWTLCTPLPKDVITVTGDKFICVTVLERVWPKILEIPVPPDPPWLTHPKLERQSAQHMQVLASIDRLAAELPAELSRDIQRSVEGHMETIGRKLGEGVRLSRYTEKT